MTSLGGDGTSGGGEEHLWRRYEPGDEVIFVSGESGVVVRALGDKAYEVLLDSPKGVVARVPAQSLPRPVRGPTGAWICRCPRTGQPAQAIRAQRQAEADVPGGFEGLDADRKWGIIIFFLFVGAWLVLG